MCKYPIITFLCLHLTFVRINFHILTKKEFFYDVTLKKGLTNFFTYIRFSWITYFIADFGYLYNQCYQLWEHSWWHWEVNTLRKRNTFRLSSTMTTYQFIRGLQKKMYRIVPFCKNDFLSKDSQYLLLPKICSKCMKNINGEIFSCR